MASMGTSTRRGSRPPGSSYAAIAASRAGVRGSAGHYAAPADRRGCERVSAWRVGYRVSPAHSPGALPRTVFGAPRSSGLKCAAGTLPRQIRLPPIVCGKWPTPGTSLPYVGAYPSALDERNPGQHVDQALERATVTHRHERVPVADEQGPVPEVALIATVLRERHALQVADGEWTSAGAGLTPVPRPELRLHLLFV